MINLDAFFQKHQHLGAYMVMCIHDELVIEVPRKFATPKFIQKVGDIMADNRGMFRRVKTPVDCKVTLKSWEDPQKLETLWKGNSDGNANQLVRTA